MKTAKIVFIGAGSAQFGLSMYKDIFSCGELTGSTLTLVDVDAKNLDLMYGLAVEMNAQTNAGLHIEKTLDRRQALPGADFVVCSIAVRRCELWRHDFAIPRKYGIRQTLGENGGPGGLFFTMRTIPMIMDIARDMEELCPNAYFLNFSNPESRIILALNRYTKVKCLGLCHGIAAGRADIARIMGRDPESIDVLAAGLNHFQWILEARDRITGKDLYPELLEKGRTNEIGFNRVSRELLYAFGKYPSCSDDHLGEYLPFGWQGGEEGYDFDWDEDNRASLQAEIARRIREHASMEDWTKPSGEQAVAAITGILHNKKTSLDSGIVYNQGCIDNLPSDLAVEVPVIVDCNGVHPWRIGKLPDGIARILNMSVGAQQMAVDAAVNGSKELALQAMLVDPVVNSIDAAKQSLDELWEINREYIRKCI